MIGGFMGVYVSAFFSGLMGSGADLMGHVEQAKRLCLTNRYL